MAASRNFIDSGALTALADGHEALPIVARKAISGEIADSTTGDARDANAGIADAVVMATADRVSGTTVITGDPSALRVLAAVADRTMVVEF